MKYIREKKNKQHSKNLGRALGKLLPHLIYLLLGLTYKICLTSCTLATLWSRYFGNTVEQVLITLEIKLCFRMIHRSLEY